MGIHDTMSASNSEIKRIIDTIFQKEVDKKIAHNRIIDGMTYDQILKQNFIELGECSDKTRELFIKKRIIPIVEKAIEAVKEGD